MISEELISVETFISFKKRRWESQNGLGWKGPIKIIKSNPSAKGRDVWLDQTNFRWHWPPDEHFEATAYFLCSGWGPSLAPRSWWADRPAPVDAAAPGGSRCLWEHVTSPYSTSSRSRSRCSGCQRQRARSVLLSVLYVLQARHWPPLFPTAETANV